VNVAPGLVASQAATRRDDTRTFVVPVPTRHHRRGRRDSGWVLTAWAIATLAGSCCRTGPATRHRAAPLGFLVLVGFVVLAEGMIAVAFGASWWGWHVLMAVALGAIVVAARVE
jgi:hypothetical protein